MTPTTVNDDSLKNGLAASAVMHTLFFLFLYFGLPVIFKPLPTHHDAVPFEIVEIADITQTRPKEPTPEAKPPAPEPPPPKPEVKPEPQQLQAPPQPKPPEPVQQAEAIKPAVKPKPPDVVKPKTDAAFTKLLNDIEKKKPVETPKTETQTESKQQTAQTSSHASTLSDRLTISEEDAVRRQIEQCWSPPIGALHAETMVVQVTGDISAEGIVQNAEVVDKSRAATDPFYRAMAESAIRALYNPRCAPLKLPADKYEEWKHFVFTFDPRDLI